MIIKLSPQRRDDRLTVKKSGDKLTINGKAYDFSKLPDGATLPTEAHDCEWILGGVDRVDGELNLTLILPHGANAPETTRFPRPIINPADGKINLPAYDGGSK